MNDSSIVRGLEPPRRLRDAVQRQPDRKRPLLADDPAQVHPFHVVHDEEVQPVALAEVEHGDDMRVVEPGHRLRFALEPADGGGVPGEGRRKQLQRHDVPPVAVPRLEDHSHAAGAKLVEQLRTARRTSALVFP